VIAAGGVTNVVGLVLIPHMISELVVTVKRLFACCAAKQRYVCTRLRPSTGHNVLIHSRSDTVTGKRVVIVMTFDYWNTTVNNTSIHKCVHFIICTSAVMSDRTVVFPLSVRMCLSVYLSVCSETEKLPPIINWLTHATCVTCVTCVHVYYSKTLETIRFCWHLTFTFELELWAWELTMMAALLWYSVVITVSLLRVDQVSKCTLIFAFFSSLIFFMMIRGQNRRQIERLR